MLRLCTSTIQNEWLNVSGVLVASLQEHAVLTKFQSPTYLTIVRPTQKLPNAMAATTANARSREC